MNRFIEFPLIGSFKSTQLRNRYFKYLVYIILMIYRKSKKTWDYAQDIQEVQKNMRLTNFFTKKINKHQNQFSHIFVWIEDPFFFIKCQFKTPYTSSKSHVFWTPCVVKHLVTTTILITTISNHVVLCTAFQKPLTVFMYCSLKPDCSIVYCSLEAPECYYVLQFRNLIVIIYSSLETWLWLCTAV